MNECVWETSDSDRDPELCQDRHDPNSAEGKGGGTCEKVTYEIRVNRGDM